MPCGRAVRLGGRLARHRARARRDRVAGGPRRGRRGRRSTGARWCPTVATASTCTARPRQWVRCWRPTSSRPPGPRRAPSTTTSPRTVNNDVRELWDGLPPGLQPADALPPARLWTMVARRARGHLRRLSRLAVHAGELRRADARAPDDRPVARGTSTRCTRPATTSIEFMVRLRRIPREEDSQGESSPASCSRQAPFPTGSRTRATAACGWPWSRRAGRRAPRRTPARAAAGPARRRARAGAGEAGRTAAAEPAAAPARRACRGPGRAGARLRGGGASRPRRPRALPRRGGGSAAALKPALAPSRCAGRRRC